MDRSKDGKLDFNEVAGFFIAVGMEPEEIMETF